MAEKSNQSAADGIRPAAFSLELSLEERFSGLQIQSTMIDSTSDFKCLTSKTPKKHYNSLPLRQAITFMYSKDKLYFYLKGSLVRRWRKNLACLQLMVLRLQHFKGFSSTSAQVIQA